MSLIEVSPFEACEGLNQYRVIDVREEHEFHGPLGRIASAELLPLGDLVANVNAVDASCSLLFVCRSGKRSGKACQQLLELGCASATNLSGGMIAWNRAGLPVLRTEPESLTSLVDQVVAWSVQVGPLNKDAALEIVHEQLGRHSVTYAAPEHRAVEALIRYFGESLAVVDPPDLDLSLASFRRSLSVL